MDVYVTILAVFTTVPAVASPIVHALTPWRKTAMGIHLMFYMLVLALTFALMTIDQFVRPDPLWFELVQIAVFTFTPLVMWWRLAMQLAARYRPVHRKDPLPPPEGPRADVREP